MLQQTEEKQQVKHNKNGKHKVNIWNLEALDDALNIGVVDSDNGGSMSNTTMQDGAKKR